jgi:hypothetical protein
MRRHLLDMEFRRVHGQTLSIACPSPPSNLINLKIEIAI